MSTINSITKKDGEVLEVGDNTNFGRIKFFHQFTAEMYVAFHEHPNQYKVEDVSKKGVGDGFFWTDELVEKYKNTYYHWEAGMPSAMESFKQSKQPKQTTKPPLGIIPMWLWREQRLDELNDAMKRYSDAGKEIPKEWVAESQTHSANLQTEMYSKYKKQSPQPKEENKERIEVSQFFYNGTNNIGEGYVLTTSKQIPKSKGPLIRLCVMAIANGDIEKDFLQRIEGYNRFISQNLYTQSQMDEYARQRSVEFIEKAMKSDWVWNRFFNKWRLLNTFYTSISEITTEELYNLFEESQSKP